MCHYCHGRTLDLTLDEFVGDLTDRIIGKVASYGGSKQVREAIRDAIRQRMGDVVPPSYPCADDQIGCH